MTDYPIAECSLSASLYQVTLQCSLAARRPKASRPLHLCSVSRPQTTTTTLELIPRIYQVAQMLHIGSLAHVINASLLIFIFSAADSFLYIASRTLYGLALLGQAPNIFRKVTKRGVPVWALLFSWPFSFLVFLNLGEGPQDGVILSTFFWSAFDTLNSLHPFGQCDGNILRNYLEYVTTGLHNSLIG